MTKSVKTLIVQFDQTCRELAFIGASHPEDRPSIEQDHQRAKAALEAKLEGLCAALEWYGAQASTLASTGLYSPEASKALAMLADDAGKLANSVLKGEAE